MAGQRLVERGEELLDGIAILDVIVNGILGLMSLRADRGFGSRQQ